MFAKVEPIKAKPPAVEGPQGGTTPMSVRFVNPLGVAEESEAGYLETTGAQRSKEHRA